MNLQQSLKFFKKILSVLRVSTIHQILKKQFLGRSKVKGKVTSEQVRKLVILETSLKSHSGPILPTHYTPRPLTLLGNVS
jgi:hypothetical protein